MAALCVLNQGEAYYYPSVCPSNPFHSFSGRLVGGGGGGGEWMDAFPVCLSGMRMIIKEAVGKADMSNVVSDPVNGGGWLSMYKAQYSTYLPS